MAVSRQLHLPQSAYSKKGGSAIRGRPEESESRSISSSTNKIFTAGIFNDRFSSNYLNTNVEICNGSLPDLVALAEHQGSGGETFSRSVSSAPELQAKIEIDSMAYANLRKCIRPLVE
jgi:hypothetical protein